MLLEQAQVVTSMMMMRMVALEDLQDKKLISINSSAISQMVTIMLRQARKVKSQWMQTLMICLMTFLLITQKLLKSIPSNMRSLHQAQTQVSKIRISVREASVTLCLQEAVLYKKALLRPHSSLDLVLSLGVTSVTRKCIGTQIRNGSPQLTICSLEITIPTQKNQLR